MPKRHGGSHGLATLVTVISAAILTDFLRRKYKVIMKYVDGVSEKIVKLTEIPLTKELMTAVIFASAMSIIWGIGFYFSHED